MTMIPDAAAIAAANAYFAGECPTISGRMRAALEAALPHLHTAESLGLFTHPDHPGYVGLPADSTDAVYIWKKDAPQFTPFSPTDAEREWVHPDVQESAEFARAYFDSLKPLTCGLECPFMNGLHCILDPHYKDYPHKVATAAGMTVTWIEADHG